MSAGVIDLTQHLSGAAYWRAFRMRMENEMEASGDSQNPRIADGHFARIYDGLVGRKKIVAVRVVGVRAYCSEHSGSADFLYPLAPEHQPEDLGSFVDIVDGRDADLAKRLLARSAAGSSVPMSPLALVRAIDIARSGESTSDAALDAAIRNAHREDLAIERETVDLMHRANSVGTGG